MKFPLIPYEVKLFDKETRQELQEFLQNKKNFPNTNEVTTAGGKLSDAWNPLGIGAYNPEIVTVDTFDKMRKHPQLAAGLAAIKLPILATNWTVSCDDKDIADFVLQTLRPIWRETIRSTLNAIDFGFSPHEKVWEWRDLRLSRKDKAGRNRVFFDKRAIVYKKIKSLHPNWITIKTDRHDNFEGIVQNYRGEMISLKPDKVFLFTHDKGTNFGNLFGTSRLKNVYDVWYWWSLLVQFMLRYFERRSSPLVIVRFPPGKSKDGEDHADIALEMGKYAINDMTVSLPSSLQADGKTYKWNIEYLQDDRRGEMFVSALNALEIKMLRGLFVPERVLTQDLRTGSYALSRTHFNVFIMQLDGLLVDIEDHFTRYIVRPLVQYNFGANAPSAYLEMERLSQQRREFLAKIFFEMAKEGMVMPALKEIARELKIPVDESMPEMPPKEKEEKPEIGKKPEKPEEKGKEEEKLSLEDKKKRGWWREPYPHENPKILEDIEDAVDKVGKEFADSLNSSILQPQLNMVLKEVEKALKGKQPLKNIWFRTLKARDEYERIREVKEAWEPLKPKLQTALSKHHRKMYLFGQKTAIEEMDLKEKGKTDSSDLDMLKARAVAVSDRWISNLKYGVEMATLNVANKTDTDIKWDVKQVFEKFRNKNLPDIAETEAMTAINLGRRRITLRHS